MTGGTGLLGKTLLETAPEGWDVVATFYNTPPPMAWRSRFQHLDVRDASAVESLMDAVRPTVVIHTASVGSVDEAERSPEAVRRVNVGGTQAVGQACREVGARLIFISSNAVFDGTRPPYDEASPLGAVNQYGLLKIEAETWVRASGLPAVIIRPILMYGWPWPGGRENVVTRWLSRLEGGHSVEAAEDLYSMPLLVTNCAEAIWAAAHQGRTGTFHLAGADRVSLVEFARATARAFDCDEELVQSVPHGRMTGFAPRPVDTSFSTSKMERELGVAPLGVREGLALLQRTRIPAR